MKNRPKRLAGRETSGRLRKQKCFNRRACKRDLPLHAGCFIPSKGLKWNAHVALLLLTTLDIAGGTPPPLFPRIPSPAGGIP